MLRLAPAIPYISDYQSKSQNTHMPSMFLFNELFLSLGV